MKLVVHHQHQNASRPFVAALRRQLNQLSRSLRIDEARFVIVREHEASPPYRIAAHLVTPGPDLHATAVDHTPGAALRKVISQLVERIRHRRSKQAARLRGDPLLRFATVGARF